MGIFFVVGGGCRMRKHAGAAVAALRYTGSRSFSKRDNELSNSVYDPVEHKDVKTVQEDLDEI